MQRRCEVKLRGRIDPGPKEGKEIRILNRIVSWTESGIKYEADQRHAEIVVRELHLEKGKSRSVTSPEEKKSMRELEEELGQQVASKYR